MSLSEEQPPIRELHPEFEPQAILQPGELFKESGIKEFALLGPYILALGEINGGGSSLKVYRNTGEDFSSSADILRPNISKEEFIKRLKKLKPNLNSVAFIRNEYNEFNVMTTIEIQELLGIVGLASSLQVRIKSEYPDIKDVSKIQPSTLYNIIEPISGVGLEKLRFVQDLPSDLVSLGFGESEASRVVYFVDQDGALASHLLIDGKGRYTLPKGISLPPEITEGLSEKRGQLVTTPSLALSYDGNVLTFSLPEGRAQHSVVTKSFITDPAKPDDIYYINEQGKVRVIDGQKMAAGIVSDIEVDLPFQESAEKAEKIIFDSHGNFLIVGSPKLETMIFEPQRMMIINRETGEKVFSVNDVDPQSISISEEGDIYYLNRDGQIRVVKTNFNRIPQGGLAAVEKARQKRLTALAQRLQTLEIGQITPSAPAPGKAKEATDLEAVLTTARKRLQEVFEPEITKAQNLEELSLVEARLATLSHDPEFSELVSQGVASNIETALSQRKTAIQAEGLTATIAGLQTRIASVGSVEEYLAVSQLALQAQETRAKLDLNLITPEQKKQIEADLKTAEQAMGEMRTQWQERFRTEAEGLVAKIEPLFAELGSPQELASLGVHPDVNQFLQLLALVDDPEIRKELRARYELLRTQTEQRISAQAGTERYSRMEQAVLTINQVDESLGELSAAFAQEVESPAQLTVWSSGHPIVTRIRALALTLPVELRAEQEEKLKTLLASLEAQARAKVQTRLRQDEAGETVAFKGRSFPVYQPTPVIFRPEIKPLRAGDSWGELQFVATDGRVYNAGLKVVNDREDPVTQQWIESSRAEAEKYFAPPAREVPKLPPNFVLTEYQEEIFSQMLKLLQFQRETQQGVLILEGEAGTGKDFSIEALAHFLNLEVVNVACNASMEGEDLIMAYEFGPEKGTYRVSSKLLQAIQRPGVLVNFIEINTLPPGVFKMLNPLFDHHRCLYSTHGAEQGVYKADSTALFVGSMNPQRYLGTKPLAPEVKSRARIMGVDYPPFRALVDEEGKRKRVAVETAVGTPDAKGRPGKLIFASDEAEILSRYSHALQILSPEEFRLLWHYHVNAVRDNGGDEFETPERLLEIDRIRQTLTIAAKVRQAYEAFHSNLSTDPVEFVFSIRETQAIVAEMNRTEDVLQATEDVVLPKIGDAEEKARVQVIIESVT